MTFGIKEESLSAKNTSPVYRAIRDETLRISPITE
jgi:hypothetical protein